MLPSLTVPTNEKVLIERPFDNSTTSSLANAQKTIDNKINSLNSLKKEHETRKATVDNYERQKVNLVSEIEKWEFAKNKKPELSNLQKEIEKFQRALTNDRRTLTEETDAINKVESRVRKKQKEKEEMLQKSAELNEIVSERSRLLGILKVHIEGGNCLLCGYNWKSPEVLLDQIQKVSGRDEKLIAQHKTEIVNIDKAISKLSRELNERKTNVGKTNNRIDETSKQIRQLQENEKDVKRAASELDLSAEKLLRLEDQFIEKSLNQSKKDLNEINANIAT